MSGINTQGSKSRLLQEGVNAVATDYYKDLPMEYDKIFTSYNSEKSYELDVAVSLRVRMRVAQISFWRLKDPIKQYSGKYAKGDNWDPEAMLPKMWKDWDSPWR